MTIVEIGGLASGLLAVITLINKIIKLITTIQSLINRLDKLQEDMITAKELWEDTANKYVGLDQRLRDVEFQMAMT